MPKFRTMHLRTPAVATHLLKNPSRHLTPIGSFLRRTSLDEVPQLWSILIGDMSFVGPRPFPTSYFDFMNSEQKKRYSVRPGITGLAQIMGRNNLSWKMKIYYDLKYIESINFFSDLIISLKTFRYLFSNKKNETLGNQSIDNFIPNFDQ
jgi:O-antigen biosynthesis protein WbqP